MCICKTQQEIFWTRVLIECKFHEVEFRNSWTIAPLNTESNFKMSLLFFKKCLSMDEFQDIFNYEYPYSENDYPLVFELIPASPGVPKQSPDQVLPLQNVG